MMQAQWANIRNRLLKTVGQNNFTTWIDPLSLGATEDGVSTLFVPTNFFGNYVSQNFADLILHEMQNENDGITRLKFTVGGAERPAALEAAKIPARPAPVQAANSNPLNTAPFGCAFQL